MNKLLATVKNLTVGKSCYISISKKYNNWMGKIKKY